ncbi:hypothetical protein SAY86_018453 [Trapa natans]|uniref:AB hydrolase-1 domain-containing protein n=1 Tax=Trapa natans TaxID=22666 RepID=A0AAN7R0Y0_TRANT|nr:hypothetical protein SAY86_018453 [Trapa natans]
MNHEQQRHHHHMILVHGIGHGAWCWYRLVDRFHSSSPDRLVTAIDLGGCGADPRSFDSILTVADYVQPLMDLLESLPSHKRVILIGHSYGGLPIALAAERFPEKVAAAVFLTAYMPGCSSPLGHLLQEYFRRGNETQFLDCTFSLEQGQQKLPTWAAFGPKYMANTLYAGCQSEDLEMAEKLIRPGQLFVDEMMRYVLTEEKYGRVKKVFILCEEDEVMNVDFQRFLIQNSPPDHVKIMEGAYHMAMLSKPKELQQCLDEIVAKYG